LFVGGYCWFERDIIKCVSDIVNCNHEVASPDHGCLHVGKHVRATSFWSESPGAVQEYFFQVRREGIQQGLGGHVVANNAQLEPAGLIAALLRYIDRTCLVGLVYPVESI
jgi:hypothetical protein